MAAGSFHFDTALRRRVRSEFTSEKGSLRRLCPQDMPPSLKTKGDTCFPESRLDISSSYDIPYTALSLAIVSRCNPSKGKILIQVGPMHPKRR